MADEFSERRLENPDYDVEVHITGVRLGTTGKVRWWVESETDFDKKVLAEIPDRAAIVLRGEGE